MTISQLRTAARANAVALQADGSNLTPTQQAALTQYIADIDAEAATPNQASVLLTDSVASNIPYDLRDALEAVPIITSALTKTQAHTVDGSYAITASHVPDSYQATYLGSTTLPAGFTLNAATGVIALASSGMIAGTYSLVVKATNSGGQGAGATVVFTIS